MSSDVSGGLTPTQKTAIENAIAHEAAAAPHSGHTSTPVKYDVTGSRAVNGIYQNTTGKVMHLIILLRGNASAARQSILYSDSATPPTEMAGDLYLGTSNNRQTLSVLIEPDAYYKLYCLNYNPTITAWIEWY